MSKNPITKAVLDHGDGALLVEGDALTEPDVSRALREKFPEESDFRRERPAVMFHYANGAQVRLWRFEGDVPRLVEGTVYL